MSNNNEPAFPCLGFYKGADGDLHPLPTVFPGISIRDYFAAQALQGMLASDARYAEKSIAEIAKEAVYAADQLTHELATARAE